MTQGWAVHHGIRVIPREGVAETAAAILYWPLVAAFCFLTLSSRYAWMLDYPNWVYQGHVAHAKLFAAAALPQYGWKTYPVPNSLITVEIALLETVCAPLLAAKLCVALLLAAFAVFLPLATGRAAPGARYQLALIGLPFLAFSSSFWNGYLGYQTGVVLLLGFLALELRNPLSPWPTALSGVLIFFAHAIPFLAFAGYVLLRQWRTRSFRRLLALAPSGALLAWYCLGQRMSAGRWEGAAPPPPIAHPSAIQLLEWKAYSAFKLGPFQNFILPDGRSFLEGHATAYYILLAGNVVFMGLLLWQGLRRLRGQPPDVRWALGLMGWILFAAYAPAPFSLFGTVNVGERFLLMACIPFLLCRPPRAWVRTLLLGIALAGLAHDGLFLWRARTMGIPDRLDRTTAVPGGGDYMQQALGHTRLKYFPHKVFVEADFYRRIETGELTAACYTSGILTYMPEAREP
jgi:hypothetical protein